MLMNCESLGSVARKARAKEGGYCRGELPGLPEIS